MKRIDVLLAERGLCRSRTAAAQAVRAGRVSADGTLVTRPSELFDETALLTVQAEENAYVSRAGIKLAAALSGFSLDVTGLTVLDVGASTGGFTDCLLAHGARRVYALDVGTNQLAASLRDDERVVSMEKRNARSMTAQDFPEAIDMITMDVSFISQTKLYDACASVLSAGKPMVTLVKPQFELTRAGVGKNGIVRDPDGRKKKQIFLALDAAAAQAGFTRARGMDSPIAGGDGNCEYLALFYRNIS